MHFFIFGLFEALNKSFIFFTNYITKTLAHPHILRTYTAEFLFGSGDVLILDYSVAKVLDMAQKVIENLADEMRVSGGLL